MSEKHRCDDSFVLDSNFSNEQSQSYDIITINTRIKLIKLVCAEGNKISQAAKLLNINESSAKYIIRTFRKKGKILIKLPKNQQLNQQQMSQLQSLRTKYYSEKQKQKNCLVKSKKNKNINKQKLKDQHGQNFQKKSPLTENKQEIQVIQNLGVVQNLPIYYNQFSYIPIFINTVQPILWAVGQNGFYH